MSTTTKSRKASKPAAKPATKTVARQKLTRVAHLMHYGALVHAVRTSKPPRTVCGQSYDIAGGKWERRVEHARVTCQRCREWMAA